VAFLCFGTALFTTLRSDGWERVGLDDERYLVAHLRTPRVEPTAAEAETYEAAFLARVGANQDEMLARLAADRDVRRVAMGMHLPGLGHPVRIMTLEGSNGGTSVEVRGARVHIDYFRGLGLDVLQGRTFTAADLEEPDPLLRRPVIVNDQFVVQVLGGGQAIGRQIPFDYGGTDAPQVVHEIVGVVETFGTDLLNPRRGATVYHPLGSADANPMGYVIEVDDDATQFIPRLRSIAASVDPDAIVENPRTIADLLAQQQMENRFVTLLVFILSAVGAVLAATGLYALMSFTVSQRTREIGIRTALGADSGDVIVAIAKRGFTQLSIGVVAGALLGWMMVTEGFDFFLAIDNIPLLVFSVAAAVAVFSVLSCLAPIRRGLRIQPTEALREA
jgi:hypothetical protein